MQRPRLLYLLNSFDAGGAEDAPARLIAGGAFDGIDVDVLALVQGQGRQIEAIKAMGVTADAMFPAERMRPSHLARALPVIRHRLASCDAILGSLPQANLLSRLTAASMRKRPLVLSFEHNSHLAKPAYETGFRLTSGIVDWRLADCAATARQAQARLYTRTPARDTVLPLVQFKAESAPARRLDKDRPLELVAAGRLTRTKNHQALIAAAARLRAMGRAARLTIHGEGPCRTDLEGQIHALGLGGNVQLPGHTAGWQRRPADIFLLSSRHEGLCIAALEAMAAGIPVIATMVGGLVDYGRNAAVLLESAEPDDFANAVAALADDPERWGRLTEAGRKVAYEDYGAAAVRSAYAAFNSDLREVLAQRRG